MALRIDYNGLTATVAQMQTAAANVQATYEDMQTTVNALVTNGYMEADSANTYVENFNSLLGPSMEDLNQLITSFHTQLTTICENFAEADRNIANAIKA